MKVIFLDIDGVLNTMVSLPLREHFVEIEGTIVGFNQLDKDAINQLNRVIGETEAKVVISSSWRIGCRTPAKWNCLIEHLRNQGVVAEVIGRTPTYGEYVNLPGIFAARFVRGDEIQLWLNDHPEVKSFVIVDDDQDMAHLTNKLVRTKFETGITERDADRMIEILKRD